ncbi:MAG: hypothetical protein ACTJGH_02070 [Peptoniphilaceae bacterium]
MKDLIKLLQLNLLTIKNYIKVSLAAYFFLFIIIVGHLFGDKLEDIMFMYAILYFITIFFILGHASTIKLDKKLFFSLPISSVKTYPIVLLTLYLAIGFTFFIPMLVYHIFGHSFIRGDLFFLMIKILFIFILILVLIKTHEKKYSKIYKSFRGFSNIFPLLILFSVNRFFKLFFPLKAEGNIVLNLNRFANLLLIFLITSFVLKIINIKNIIYEDIKSKKSKESNLSFEDKNFSILKILVWTKLLSFKDKNNLILLLFPLISIFCIFYFSDNSYTFYFISFILVIFVDFIEPAFNQKFLLLLPFDYYRTLNKLQILKFSFIVILSGLVLGISYYFIDFNSTFINRFIIFLIINFVILIISEFSPKFSIIFYRIIMTIYINFFILQVYIPYKAENLNTNKLLIFLASTFFLYLFSLYRSNKREVNLVNIIEKSN